MKIPIWEAGENIADLSPAYIIGRDGFYMRKTSKLYDSVVKVQSIPDYEKVEEYVEMSVPKIPYALILEALEFFRAVYDLYEAEAISMLTFEANQWRNAVPKQKVSGANLDYECEHISNIAGTIHSHGNMDAFFSETDHKDVAGFDGVHIVLGKIDRNVPRIKAGVYVNGRLFEFEPDDLIEDLPPEHEVNHDHPWLDRVEHKRASSIECNKHEFLDMPF